MAKYVLEIVYSQAEIKALGSTTFLQNQAVAKNAPFNPWVKEGLSPSDDINQFKDYSRDFGLQTKVCPFKILMRNSASADGKNNFSIYTVCE